MKAFIVFLLLASAARALVLSPYRSLRLVPVTNDPPSPLHSAYLCNFLSPEDARFVVDAATAYAAGRAAASSGGDDFDDDGWLTDRHAQYATTDFAVKDCSELDAFWKPRLKDTILPSLAHLFSVPETALLIDDLFIVKYEGNDDQQASGGGGDSSSSSSSSSSTSTTTRSGSSSSGGSGGIAEKQDRLGSHYDDTLLSFSVLLSDPTSDFEGGGTSFTASDWVEDGADFRAVVEEVDGGTGAVPLVDVVRPAHQGDLFAHCGRLLHGGAPVTKGTRLLLVGFAHVTGGLEQRDSYEEYLIGMGRLRHARRLAETERLCRHPAFRGLAEPAFQQAAQAQLEYEYASAALRDDAYSSYSSSSSSDEGEGGSGNGGGSRPRRPPPPPEFTIVTQDG